MTGSSIREYTEAVGWRYLRTSKKEKGMILDEFTKVIGYHRKAAIRLLRRGNQPSANKKRGRPQLYGAVVVGALRLAWEATDRLCSKRLHWQEDHPGFLEVDLVSHCGENSEGFYLTTLSEVDVATGWSECIGVWGKGQERVGGGVHRVRKRLPFPLLGLDSDNGSEFINQHLYSYCRREGITFTRSRSYKKNDSCYVEQKNWSVVRRLVGYDRYSSRAALEALNRVYVCSASTSTSSSQ